MKRDYSIVASYLVFTDDPAEMERLGRRITADYRDIYTPLMMEKMFEGVREHIPDADPQFQEKMVYRSIYDYWAYGCRVDEEFYLHYNTMTHEQKLEYLPDRMRIIYNKHLNSEGDPDLIDLLEDKYRLYQRLKPYFMREMIELKSEEDFAEFAAFAKRHEAFVVKPSNFWCGTGIHKSSLRDFGGDARAAFDAILAEGQAIHARHPSRNTKIVLEELIEQYAALAVLHPSSVNGVRATAVRGKDGRVHVYHPWIKAGVNGAFVASAALNGFDAEIDPETGIVISDGCLENGTVYQVHPDTGIRLKGFRIPRWDELLALVDALMQELPEFGYIGWDLVLTPKGWCVMEGNYYGDFMFQMINGRGYRREFEALIGWKFEKDFWWQQ